MAQQWTTPANGNKVKLTNSAVTVRQRRYDNMQHRRENAKVVFPLCGASTLYCDVFCRLDPTLLLPVHYSSIVAGRYRERTLVASIYRSKQCFHEPSAHWDRLTTL